MDTIARMDPNAIAEKLSSLIEELQSLHRMISEGPGTLPAEARSMLKKRICLGCGKPIPADERSVRGNHEACWKRIQRAIEAGRMTEDEAIQNGFLAPKRTGGRPQKHTRLSEYLRQKDTAAQKTSEFDELASNAVAEMAADLDAAIARDEAEQAAKPPVTSPKRSRKKKGA